MADDALTEAGRKGGAFAGYRRGMNAVRVNGLGRTVRGEDGSPFVLFKDLDLLLTPGRAVGLTGPDDAGGGAVLRVLAGLDRASAGEIEFLRRPDEPKRHASVTSQRRSLVHAGVLAPLFAADVAAGLRELRTFGTASAEDAVRLVPKDILARAVAEPSDAVRPPKDALRRIAIAAAAAIRPRAVLISVDRPHPDRAERLRLVAVIRSVLAAGPAVVLATQDERLLAAVASEILILFDGTVTARGAPEETIPAAVSELGREVPP